MHYFVVFNIAIMVGIAVNIELIADVFSRPAGLQGCSCLCFQFYLLVNYLFGVYVNLSVWFKIKDRTLYGTYFTAIGALVTLVGHLWLVPIIGYYGSAISALVCYASYVCDVLFCRSESIFQYRTTSKSSLLIWSLLLQLYMDRI